MRLEANPKARLEHKLFVWKVIPVNIGVGVERQHREGKEANSGSVDR